MNLILDFLRDPVMLRGDAAAPTAHIPRQLHPHHTGPRRPAFFAPKPRREGSKLTAEFLTKAQSMLDAGAAVPHVSAELGVLQTTLYKAIGDGRLKKKLDPLPTILPPASH